MMKSVQNWLRTDLVEPLNGTKKWHVLGKSKMRSDVVVVGGISGKDPAQMGPTEDDDVIEAFPADRTNQPLRMAILPR